MGFSNDFEPVNTLHDWTIEHYRGDKLPDFYDENDAKRDYDKFSHTKDFPSDLSPLQLQFEVTTMIIEALGGNPF